MANRSLLPTLWRSERTWNPVREMNRMQRRMDRMFDEYFADPFARISRELPTLTEFEEEMIPPCDVNELETSYMISFDLPGMKRDDVRLEIKDSQLIVSGERKKEHLEEVKGRYSQERYFGAFSRSFNLPSQVDPTRIEANFENGVLQILLPKTEVSKTKQISIKEGKLLSHEKKTKEEKAA